MTVPEVKDHFRLNLPPDFEYYVWNLETNATRPPTTLVKAGLELGIEKKTLERLHYLPVQNYYDFPCFKSNPKLRKVRLIPIRNIQGYTFWNPHDEFAPWRSQMRFRKFHMPMKPAERAALNAYHAEEI